MCKKLKVKNQCWIFRRFTYKNVGEFQSKTSITRKTSKKSADVLVYDEEF